MAIRLALLSGHYRTDRAWTGDLLTRRAGAAGHAGAGRSRRDAGAPAAPLLAGLRERLADDLDSPGALALVDAWAARTLAGDAGRARTRRRGSCCDAVDALLGVALDRRHCG